MDKTNDKLSYELWLRTKARYELEQLEWYNAIAAYVTNNPDTLMLMTPHEAGWE